MSLSIFMSVLHSQKKLYHHNKLDYSEGLKPSMEARLLEQLDLLEFLQDIRCSLTS